MLEAVNSVVSNAAVISASTKQVSEAPVKASPDKIKTLDVDPFLSRGLKYDEQLQRPVLQIRDTSTGDTLKQFPTETQIKAYTSRQGVTPAIDVSAPVQTSTADAPIDIKVDAPAPVEVNVAPAQAPTQNSSAATLAVNIDTQA